MNFKKILDSIKSKKKIELLNEPVQIDISITEKCCLECKFCDCWKREISDKEVSIDEWKKFLKEVKELSPIKFLCIGGGEPFMKEGIIDLLKFCKKEDILTVIITNGFLLNKKKIKEVCDSGLQIINFSLDGFEKTHDSLRGRKGVFKKIVNAINEFKRLRPEMPVGLSTMINGKNISELIDFVEWIQKNKNINYINFQAIERVVRYDGPKWYKKEKLWPQDFNKTDEVLDKLLLLKKKGYKIHNPESQFEVFKKYFRNPTNTDRLFCKAGFLSIPIGAYGDVSLCVKEQSAGNIKKDSIKKIYYSKIADKIRNKSKDCNEKCHFLVNCYYDERKE